VTDPQSKALDIEYHRHAAEEYDEAVTQHFHFYHVYSLHRWAKSLVRRRPGAVVLDMGTGTGVVACTMAALGCEVKAIDHSLDMLARATARAKLAGLTDLVRFELADCEHLRYSDSSFDAVTIQGVLHHLPDVMPTLHEAVRVLKPGGEIYISEPCAEGSVISRVTHAALTPFRLVRNLLAGRPVEPQVADHEDSISGPGLVQAVQSLGIRTRKEFLVRLGVVRFLPQRWRIWPILLLSAPTRYTNGDMVFITGRKMNIAAAAPKPVETPFSSQPVSIPQHLVTRP
jgi:ubiquinone/menaquinone biosynthesis C-methylase UbiE